ncbi:MAG: GAF domain-containing protein, partial [Gemmatimonadota bacterium]|nr:GAF domain-containing protein [Gemmatimonadota bacterium]
GEIDIPDILNETTLSAFVAHPAPPRQLLLALRSAFRDAAYRSQVAALTTAEAVRSEELDELTRIGAALNTERDYHKLQDMILTQARRVSRSDAGSLYLVERENGKPVRLRFKHAQNQSRPDMPLVEFTIPLDTTSIAGYVASTASPLILDDAYEISKDADYSFNRTIDEKHDYRTKSILTIPMRNQRDEVIGVLQLINKKDNFATVLKTEGDFGTKVLPFDERTVTIVSSLAGQAAVSIENSQLYERIERLFEGFVTAAVTAIEQRDPTTFGHSGRVADMTVAIAETTDRAGTGSLRDVTFSKEQIREIRYAGLLHDFGKVGVREQVLVKAKKLYPTDLALIRQRYGFIRRTIERNFQTERAEFLEHHGKEGYAAFFEKLNAEHRDKLAELDRFLALVMESNEPTVLPEGNFTELLGYSEVTYEDIEGRTQPYLETDEVRYLTIRKGSLDESERAEIESHVNHTYNFLLQIPWTEELKHIPHIAFGHHEKLNGGGYPRGVRGPEIPIQTRMMTIADIFDALTASDRPYKRAVPTQTALDIMSMEVKDGHLDADLFDLFHQAKVYDVVLGGAE